MKFVMFMNDKDFLPEIHVKNLDEVFGVINSNCYIEHDAVMYNGDPVDAAIYVDTEAKTSELFKLSARVVSEIVIS